MRALALIGVLALGACSSVGGSAFRNEQTGQIEEGCGPMQGLSFAIERAQQGCEESYQNDGWTRLGPM